MLRPLPTVARTDTDEGLSRRFDVGSTTSLAEWRSPQIGMVYGLAKTSNAKMCVRIDSALHLDNRERLARTESKWQYKGTTNLSTSPPGNASSFRCTAGRTRMTRFYGIRSSQSRATTAVTATGTATPARSLPTTTWRSSHMPKRATGSSGSVSSTAPRQFTRNRRTAPEGAAHPTNRKHSGWALSDCHRLPDPNWGERP